MSQRRSVTDEWLTAVLLSTLLLSGCSSTNGDKDEEQRARERISIARALEADSLRFEAAVEYAIVADIYPSTRYYETAVRKAALLFCDPENEARSDSTIDRWFAAYRKLPMSEEEREILESHIRLISEVRTYRIFLEEEKDRADSLSAVGRMQQAELAAAEKGARERIRKLERELEEARKELEKLREIDIKVGREKQDDE